MEKYVSNCKYCERNVDILQSECLVCKVCDKNVHVTCLQRQSTPGGIYGDVFFEYSCKECSETKTEIFMREKMTWFQVIILAMYHLQYKNLGIANNGFFHWKIHLITFINKNWNVFFKKDFKQRKNWMGTVSGTLSHFSPYFFTSGATYLKSSGWWRLTYPKLSPSFTFLIHNEFSVYKQTSAIKSLDDSQVVRNLIEKHLPKKHQADYLQEVAPSLPETNPINTDPSEHCTEDIDVTGDEIVAPCLNMSGNIFVHDYNLYQALEATEFHQPEEVQKESAKKSLFSKSTHSDFYTFWQKHEPKTVTTTTTGLKPLRIVEEKLLCQYLTKYGNPNFGPEIKLRALRRKLQVRCIKRAKNIPLFNADEAILPQNECVQREKNRFSHYAGTGKDSTRQRNESVLLMSGSTELTDLLLSPYTNRLLKPYIRKDSCPEGALWCRLMRELDYKVNLSKGSGSGDPREFHSLDYCYVRPNHIPALNSLCERFFWPGIDLTEALEYPDFSCVVSYRKLIVGFAFMVPDVKFNETYISFVFTRPEWRRAGIATFMIYHLIQTCMGKDVTLHVAIDNPAIFLYQKFGFKVEEVVFNFYDTYLRDDSNKCKHAFFLRLER